MSSLLHDLHIEPHALVVNIVSFVLLIWLMKRFLFGPIGSFIEQRKRLIAQELDDAEADRTKAAAERTDIESRRAEIMQRVQDEADAGREAAASEAQEIKDSARKAARELERSARAATEQERREAAIALRNELNDSATAMCRRLLRETLDEDRHRALLDQFIADIEKMAREQQSS